MSDEATGLLSSRDGGVLTLTLNRPEVHNALDWRTRDALVAALANADADLAVRAIILTGAGDRAFCTGADLRVPLPALERPADAPARAQGEISRGIATGWQRVITAVMDCGKPIVAAVNGTAAGAGMHLALACDIVVMSAETKLVPVFVRRGIAPDACGPYLLTRLLGPARAKLVYLLGDDIPADLAERWGLVAEVVPPKKVHDQAMAFAQRLAIGPTRTLAVSKRLLNSALDLSRESALLEEAWAQELVMSTQDAQEGVQAFIERRESNFRGW